MNYTAAVTKHIKVLVNDLKGEQQLIEALKRKLTKKEFKVFTALESGISREEALIELRIDAIRLEEIEKALHKKLNQEKIKQELCD